MKFSNEPVNHPTATHLDWPTIKAEIAAKLDLEAEYASLGVDFTDATKGGNSKGVRQCHAVGRKDDVPSAFVNTRTGVYHDSGGEGATLGFFDFALKYGSHGRWIDCLKHYAEKAGVEIPSVVVGKGGKIKEAEYHYHDELGGLSYAVFRYRLPNGKKTFSQQPSDGKGGWVHGTGCMDSVPPLPYRLPELLRSREADDPVWVVEGEKDADRLAALGLVATTNHQGANSTNTTWSRFSPAWFAGRECFVLPDHDSGGRKHAAKVADYLRSFGAASVKVVELPGLPVKGDVSDWLDLGHDLDELCKLAHSFREWDGTLDTVEVVAEVDENRTATAADLRKALSESSGWVIPLWIPGSALTLLASEAGQGKTRFCMDLHRRIVNGLTWPDGTAITLPRDSKFLWVAADNQHQEIAELPAEFGIPEELVLVNATASDPFGGTELQSTEDLLAFEDRIARDKPVLVIIDTITNTSDLKSQDTSDAKRQYKPLQEIAMRQKVAIVCVTHLNTAGKAIGRRAPEKVRVVIQLSCPDPEGQPNRRKLWVDKSKAQKPKPMGITMSDTGNEYDLNPPEAPKLNRHGNAVRGPAPTKITECMSWLETILRQGRSRVKLILEAGAEKGYTVGTCYTAKDRLEAIEEKEGRLTYWSLKNQENGDHPPTIPINGKSNDYVIPDSGAPY